MVYAARRKSRKASRRPAFKRRGGRTFRRKRRYTAKRYGRSFKRPGGRRVSANYRRPPRTFSRRGKFSRRVNKRFGRRSFRPTLRTKASAAFTRNLLASQTKRGSKKSVSGDTLRVGSGTQNFSFIHSLNNLPDLQNINFGQPSLDTKRMYVRRSMLMNQFRNDGQNTVFMDIYEVIPRYDLPAAGNGYVQWNDLVRADHTGEDAGSKRRLGYTIFQNEWFTRRFKVVRTKHYRIAPGKDVFHKVFWNKRIRLDNNTLQFGINDVQGDAGYGQNEKHFIKGQAIAVFARVHADIVGMRTSLALPEDQEVVIGAPQDDATLGVVNLNYISTKIYDWEVLPKYPVGVGKFERTVVTDLAAAQEFFGIGASGDFVGAQGDRVPVNLQREWAAAAPPIETAI